MIEGDMRMYVQLSFQQDSTQLARSSTEDGKVCVPCRV